MSPRRASIPVLVLLAAACFPAVAQEPLRTALDQCRPRLDTQLDVGYARIAAECPRLIRVLESSEWRAWLPPGWREPGNDLSIGGLEELATLIEQERSRERAGPRPGTGALREVLAGLETARTERAGFWGRLRQWMDRVFRSNPSSTPSEWPEGAAGYRPLSSTLIEVVTLVALALVVAMALLIVANEVRHASVFRRRATPEKMDPRAPLPGAGVLRWQDVQQAPAADRLALLLRLVADRLTRSDRLPPAASLTTREIEARARIAAAEDRARLGVLAAAAEQTRFAPVMPEPAILDDALRAGSELLVRLEHERMRAP